MFNTRMTSGWHGSCVANLRRIEGPAVLARLRQDQVDFLGDDAMQRFGTPKA